jgi:hypothetical protein
MDTEVFVYTGRQGGNNVPQDVERVRVDPSVTSIPAHAFSRRNKLTEVELCEGLVEIGAYAFRFCGHSITKLNIPTSLRRISDDAFWGSLRCPIRLHDGIESIVDGAFAACIFTNFRVPPLVTVIPSGVLWNCKSLFSVELFENISEIKVSAFEYCYCLRNVAFPPNAVFGDNIFINESLDTSFSDLYQLFGTEAEIIRELQHRFDGLPIHSIVYFQLYNQGVLQILLAAINMRSCQRRTLRPKLNPTGNQQDCLGMTPLHILACSSVHNLEMYRLIVAKYPANLITVDRWGATPLLYAFWGAAPVEIIEFLLDSYQFYYPDHVINWTMMVETMGRCHTPNENFESLLCAKQMHFPEQPLDWEYLLTECASSSLRFQNAVMFQEQMRFLFMCGLSVRVEALAFKVWRDYVTNMIHIATFVVGRDNSAILREICNKFAYYEDKFTKLKEVTTILELALWKMKMNENGHQDMATHDSNVRSQDRVTCGADVVIGHVLPFIIRTD